MGTRDCLSKRREDLRYLNLFAIHCYIDPGGQAMESACTLLLNLDSTFLGLFWIQPNLIIRGSCQNDYHALMDQVCAVNKSIYTVNPSHFLVFWPFRSMEFKSYWNRSMGARDNKGGGGALNGQEVEVLKGIGGGDTGGGTQLCLIIAMGESQETQDAGQTQEAGGLDPLLPHPPPPPPQQVR